MSGIGIDLSVAAVDLQRDVSLDSRGSWPTRIDDCPFETAA